MTGHVKPIYIAFISFICMYVYIAIKLCFLTQNLPSTTDDKLQLMRVFGASSSDKTVPFKGTKIYPRSHGIDTLEYVCVVPGGREGAYSELHSFTNDALPKITSTWRYMKRPSAFSTWMTLTKGHNISDWDEWLLNPKIKYVKEETLFVLDMWGNPAHCLTDIAFSIFLDAYTNDDADATPDTSISMTMMRRVDYPSFQPAYFTGLGPDKVPNTHWFWYLMQSARLIDIDSFNQRNASNPLYNQTVCYRKLLMPMPQVHRFPIDWTDSRATSDLMPSQGVGPHLSMRQYIQDTNITLQPSIEPLYPAKAIHRARTRIFQSFGWTMTETIDNDRGNDVPVLFYGRHNTKKRVWMNQEKVQKVLERDYRVQVDTADGTWNSLTAAEQAQLYHKYTRIVTPHGAHLANMIYCRNNTRVVEIVLARVEPASNVTMMGGDDPSKPLSDWYGPHTWFSFARRMGVHHFAYGEANVPGGFDAKAFNISSIDAFVSFLATRLELPRRETSFTASTISDEMLMSDNHPEPLTIDHRPSKMNQDPPWITYEMNHDNIEINQHHTLSMPDESDWLQSNADHQYYESQKLIPKYLHKVILTSDGGYPDYFPTIMKFGVQPTLDDNGNALQEMAVEEGSIEEAHLSWKNRNPGYEIRYFNLHECRQYLAQYYHPLFLRAFDCIEAFAGKADLFRYLVVYREGGYYSDWKQVCLVDGLLDQLTLSNSSQQELWDKPAVGSTTFFSTWDPNGMQCAFFGAVPQSPILAEAIRISLYNIQQRADLKPGANPFNMAGPGVFYEAFKKAGKSIDGVRLGRFYWRDNGKNQFFDWEGKPIINHKCEKCGHDQSWSVGNNYNKKLRTGEYFCPDATSIFAPNGNETISP